MTAIKSMVGHTSGSSGLLGLIVALKALAAGRVPPTLAWTNPRTPPAGSASCAAGRRRPS
ncbi:hypothetical protein NKH77_20495 [Streptomyces sp. M19]